MSYRLLTEFRALFEGHRYLHRNSSLGDFVARHLFEDLYELGRSQKLVSRVDAKRSVINSRNTRQGILARRGDGTLGESVPGSITIVDKDFRVSCGNVATIEIGVEVKILAKAMIKQIDRVVGDLRKQVGQFRKGGGNPISIAIVGVNHADTMKSYEGKRSYKTDGKANRHPCQEADEATRRLIAYAKPEFSEFLILPFKASNERPFPFEWVDYESIEQDYAAALVRISRAYEERFSN